MKKVPPDTPALVFVFALIVVGAPFSVGVVTTISAIRESTDTKETQGIVVDFETSRSGGRGGGTVRKPIVVYYVAGQAYRCKGTVGANPSPYAVGDKVTVLYKINDPGDAFVDSFFERWLCPLLFAGVGGVFFVILLVLTIRKIMGQRVATRSAA